MASVAQLNNSQVKGVLPSGSVRCGARWGGLSPAALAGFRWAGGRGNVAAFGPENYAHPGGE